MATVTSKIMELLRNLKSDAVPKPPRSEPTEADSSTDRPIVDDADTGDSPPNNKKQPDEDEDYEEIIFGEEDFVKEKKKPKFPFKTKKSKGDKEPKEPKGPKVDKNGVFCSVNTQATGAVYNVVNASNVQVGSNHVYYMSATNKGGNKQEKCDDDDNDEENYVSKDNCIALLMESDIEPTFKYMNFISKNLGMNWKAFYTSLGYLKGYMDTLVLEHGIIEARYKLLDDWVKNDDDGSLGRLATLLWEAGERQIVRELSLIYKESKK